MANILSRNRFVLALIEAEKEGSKETQPPFDSPGKRGGQEKRKALTLATWKRKGEKFA